jgi:septum formation inhibitor MinC
MDAATAALHPPVDATGELPQRPAALLRGTARGLEIVIDARETVEAITSAVMMRLDEAPAFFRGSDVRIRVEEGVLPAGCLARIDELAMMFELRIVEVTAARRGRDEDAVPTPNLAAGSAPSPAGVFDEEAPTHATAAPLALPPPPTAELAREPQVLADGELVEVIGLVELPDDGAEAADGISFEEPTQTTAPIALAASPEAELETASAGTRIVVGPVRSGVILEHTGHLIVFGDINPGAEVRAAGNIVVLGRLRGTAHAGIGQDSGFIVALRLEPQQLRVGRMVARAADADTPGTEPEIAYATGDRIVVERYLGKLPRNLATSL